MLCLRLWQHVCVKLFTFNLKTILEVSLLLKESYGQICVCYGEQGSRSSNLLIEIFWVLILNRTTQSSYIYWCHSFNFLEKRVILGDRHLFITLFCVRFDLFSCSVTEKRWTNPIWERKRERVTCMLMLSFLSWDMHDKAKMKMKRGQLHCSFWME